MSEEESDYEPQVEDRPTKRAKTSSSVAETFAMAESVQTMQSFPFISSQFMPGATTGNMQTDALIPTSPAKLQELRRMVALSLDPASLPTHFDMEARPPTGSERREVEKARRERMNDELRGLQQELADAMHVFPSLWPARLEVGRRIGVFGEDDPEPIVNTDPPIAPKMSIIMSARDVLFVLKNELARVLLKNSAQLE
jgi:hypothetical protein